MLAGGADESEDVDDESFSLARLPNRYVEAMGNISAPELIRGFAETAPAEVQAAVRQTVVSLLGNLPPDVYDVNVLSTGQNVATLMYSMQMTGYMFRNAEYRRSLLESLDHGETAAGSSAAAADVEEAAGGGVEPSVLPPVSGRIKVRLSDAIETEVEASAYMAELRNEVSALRSEIESARAVEAADEAEKKGGLLTYMQGLGRENVEALTSDVSKVRAWAYGTR